MELMALSESGLAYSRNEFDIGRFHQVGVIAERLMREVAADDRPDYDPAVASVAGYATPKIDVRGGVFNADGDVLLVREVADHGRWTLPGGWGDILETPSVAVEREVFEEAGLRVRAVELAAVLDREKWGHVPPVDRHIYKLFFVCEPLEDADLSYVSNETSGIGWFRVDDLPELSIGRVLPEQIRILQRHWRKRGPAEFD